MTAPTSASKDLDTRSSSFSVGWFGAGIVLWCLALPVGIVLVTPAPLYGTWGIALTLSIVVGLRYAWLIAAGVRRLYELSLLLFSYVFLGLAPLVQLRLDISPSTTPGLDAWANQQAFWVIGAGLTAFGVGAAVAKPSATARPRTTSVRPGRTYVLVGVGVLAGTYYLSSVGLQTFLGSREELFNRASQVWPNSTTRALVQAFATMTLLVAGLALVEVRRQRRAAGSSASAVPAFLVLLLLIVIVNPISSPRYIFGTVFLAIATAIGMFGTVRRFRLLGTAAIGATVLIFPIADAFRRAGTVAAELQSPVASLTSGDFDSYGQISNAVLFVQDQGITWGRQLLGVAAFWVPRFLWSDKPIDTGSLLADSRGYGFRNLSAPLWAEFFVNGGWLLVVVGFLCVGIVCRRLDLATVTRLRAVSAPTVLGCILPFYTVILLRGSLLQAMAWLAVLLMSAWFVGRRPTEPGHPSGVLLTASTRRPDPRPAPLSRRSTDVGAAP